MLKTSPARLALIATAATAMLLTSACGGRGGKNKDTAYVARDVDTRYMAAALFDEVERQHP